VLPAAFAADPERLRRFEQEARTTGALNHPNVLAVLDVGSHDGAPYLVAELLEGETLRERLETGPLPPRRAVELAEQVAHGLAAAHEKGIVHRDLKPENLFVTRDGRVKILDFGLAKLSSAPEAPADRTITPSQDLRTAEGVVLGTAGYMSPEQVRGRSADHRADTFAFGAILYEMLTGSRAFARETGAETMTAILRDEPPKLAAPGLPVPAALDRIVRHCLEKSPEQRFQSARDLAFALHAAFEGSGAAETQARAATSAVRSRRARLALPLAALALVTVAAGGYLTGRLVRSGAASEPVFKRLTFGRGTIRAARFAPDGKIVVYGAAWDGQPITLFLTRTDALESTPLALPEAELLAMSPTGELAVSLGHSFSGWMGAGTLARAPLLGGGARPVIENVREADWPPAGSELAIVRRVDGRERLEYPPGRVLFTGSGYLSHIRFSPRGDRIAFADHPVYADDFGSLAVVDLAGAVTHLTGPTQGLRGIAWSPSGDEVLFTANFGNQNMTLYAVTLAGRRRCVLGGVSHMVLFDISRDGRMLLGRDTNLRHVEALVAGAAGPQDVALVRESPVGRFISPDGTLLPITDQYEDLYATYLRRADGSPPVRLGDGDGYDLSPDGKWVVALTGESLPRILLHPTGTGQSREVANPEGLVFDCARWLPPGERIIAFGRAAGRPTRGFVLDVGGAPPRPFTEEGVTASTINAIPVSRDGVHVIALDPRGGFTEYRTDGGAARPGPGLAAGDVPIEYSDDGRSLFVGRRDGAGWRVLKLDPATGRSAVWTEIRPSESAGLRLSGIYITPNGRYWVHTYSRLLTDLYTVEGLL
jgi:hypothetical protein